MKAVVAGSPKAVSTVSSSRPCSLMWAPSAGATKATIPAFKKDPFKIQFEVLSFSLFASLILFPLSLPARASRSIVGHLPKSRQRPRYQPFTAVLLLPFLFQLFLEYFFCSIFIVVLSLMGPVLSTLPGERERHCIR
jgi:hypothetical protein